MKHAGTVKWMVGSALVALVGSVGCRQNEGRPATAAVERPTEPAGITNNAPTRPNVVVNESTPKRPDPPAQPAIASPERPPVDKPASTKSAGTPSEPKGPPVESAAGANPVEVRSSVPLVDHVDQLQRLHPTFPVWFDKTQRQVVLVGVICQNRVPLELFACQRGSKEHESIISIDAQAHLVHAGLIAAGADPGNPVQYQPKFVPARGPEVEVTIVWKDAQGQPHQARGQDWVRHMKSGKALEYPWVFAGSLFSTDRRDGQQYYHADFEGDLICVSNFPAAVLDLPVPSSDSNDALSFEAFSERIPPVGTPVTILLRPKLDGKSKVPAPAPPTSQKSAT